MLYLNKGKEMISWRIKKVVKKTKTYFEATYKKHYFIIEWDKTCDSWSIRVWSDNGEGMASYLGHWGNSGYDIDDAIYEAMRGSGLI